MQVNVLPGAMILGGLLSEETSLSELLASFEKVKSSGSKPPYAVDFSKVTRANSAGIVTWLKFVNQTKTPLKYVNAPVWLVRQFNMIDGYFEHGSFVESFQAPLFSNDNEYAKIVNYKVGKDIPLKDSYSGFSIPSLELDGHTYEIDFDPEQYLSFISRNLDQFKRNLG